MIKLKQIKQLDYLMLFSALVLLGIGWFAVYSTSYEQRLATGIDYAQKQLMWICIAVAIFFVAVVIDYHFLLKISFIIYAVILGLLLFVLIWGELRYGARRWISIFGFSFQPSELAKLGIILVVSKYLVMDIDSRNKLRYIIVCGLVLMVPMMLILKQPDLGTALVFIPTIVVMLFVAGIAWKKLLVLGLVGIMSMPFTWFFLKAYQKKRLLSFVNPEQDPQGAGYSIIQSKIAVGSGGFLGKGWLSGTQNRLNFLPERHTDFIFSILGEEWGFVGAVIVLILFFLIIAAGFNIVRKAPDLSGRILAVGLITMFSVQVIINIGMTIGLMPVTGLPLPFISYGGTSLVTTMATLGLLQNIYIRRFMF